MTWAGLRVFLAGVSRPLEGLPEELVAARRELAEKDAELELAAATARTLADRLDACVGLLEVAQRERDAAAADRYRARRHTADLVAQLAELRAHPDAVAREWKRAADQDRANARTMADQLRELRSEKEALEHQLAWVTGRSGREPALAEVVAR